MGLPSIHVRFTTAAAATIARSEKGVVAVVVRDSKCGGRHTLTDATQIPAELGAANRSYVARAFLGYVNAPRKVLLYVLPTDATDLSEALGWLATQDFDYLVGPQDITAEEAGAVKSWVQGQRADHNARYKAVLPELAADSEAVVNFVTTGIQLGGDTVCTPGEYCARIAGLIAGTPMNISCTYAPLPEVVDVDRLTKEAADAAVDAGKLILVHDGEKVKVGRGVNSLVTTTADKGSIFRKLKVVEAVDMIQGDIRRTCEDSYIGKYPNSYDNKLVLVSAVKGYFEALERSGILQSGTSKVEIDLAAQKGWLKSQGVDISKLNDQQIREHDTQDQVFLAASIKILDVIEDIRLDIRL